MNDALKPARLCPHCHSTALEENEQAQFYCTACGRVIEGIAFSTSVTFANLRMDGQVIDVNERSNRGSVQKRLKRARAKMEELRDLLKIDIDDDVAMQAGMRVMRYANSLNFFDKGKNIDIYSAAAYYITLRFIKAPYLLIDFSDKMNVNLFKLARCFIRLLRFLGFENQLPLIDPSLYIHRYCKILELGDKTRAVTMTAIKLIQRMKRDWMCQGRRPSSLCGAAILIATKIHDVKCSTNEICKTVFVCDETIRRRLEEFKNTSVAKLTKEEFEQMNDQMEAVGDQMDPPSFVKARLKSRELQVKRRIEAQMASLPRKGKGKEEKIPWEQFRQNLNIPEEMLAKQVKGIEKELAQARERYEHDSYEESDQLSHFTENIFEDIDSGDEEVKDEVKLDENEDKSIDEEEVNKFILNEEEQRIKKGIWIQHNSAWLQKQKAKGISATKIEKRRIRKRHESKQGKDVFESIKNTKLGDNVNDEKLKQLLGSSPQPNVKKKASVQLQKMFDAFAFPWAPS